MDRGAWQATVHRVTELNLVTKQLLHILQIPAQIPECKDYYSLLLLFSPPYYYFFISQMKKKMGLEGLKVYKLMSGRAGIQMGSS